MINSLYQRFRDWSEEGSIYIISDPHFGDTDMNWRWALIEDYPFAVLDTLDPDYIAACISEYLVWRINGIVHKHDTIIILGDVGDVSYIKRIKAEYKVLIQGNHDSGVNNYTRKVYFEEYPLDTIAKDIRDKNPEFIRFVDIPEVQDVKVACFDNKLFNEVYEGPLFISDKILLSHEPIKSEIPCYLNIHGHLHNMSDDYKDQFSEVEKYPNYLCVSCEKINFTPINLGKLIKDGRLSGIDNIHRFTIDKATRRKETRNNGKTV